MHRSPILLRPITFYAALAAAATSVGAAAGERLDEPARRVVRRYCTTCHAGRSADAQLDLERLSQAESVGTDFKDWKRVVRVLRAGTMPPAGEPQPEAAVREATAQAVESSLAAYVERHAGDPGPVVLRRLSGAEYAYTIEDLTGLDLGLDAGFDGDAVGGEGFTNVGTAQFMQDSTLERYLAAAHKVADHAVVGARPITFYPHPGPTGRELSAVARIQQLYREHGFRTAAGEGARPFGLDLYPRAFFVAWQYRNRARLGPGDATLAELARREALSERLAEHVWNALHVAEAGFPLSRIAAQWQALPQPDEAEAAAKARAACAALGRELREWQSKLAAVSGDEEEAAVLTAGEVQVRRTHSFRAALAWADDATEAVVELSVTSASARPVGDALVVWRNPRLRFRSRDGTRGDETPLAAHLAPESLRKLKFGRRPDGSPIDANDFVLRGETVVAVRLKVPPETTSARLSIDVELDVEHGADCVVRCRIADVTAAGKTAAAIGAASVLLADPHGAAADEWRAGVVEFAQWLPEVSQREPAPSDRDPIPPPFDGTYNSTERNHFHYAVKYHRDDRFLVEHVLDDAQRRELDSAWADLLTSFDYHDAQLRFLSNKFGFAAASRTADLDRAAVDRLPDEARGWVQRLYDEEHSLRQVLRAAEPGHVEDVLRLADRAWRRPLGEHERRRLRDFYAELRGPGQLDHVAAVRALLVRVLAAPEFLYRAETTGGGSSATGAAADAPRIAPLSDDELAGRLSYFLWSSLPDDELRRAAAAGELRDPERLAEQARRMLRDPKARRLATEFFGQWFGFYRFDEFRGIDAERFPEFNAALKGSLYDEAVAFFEHLVRADRPAAEILFADYAFLDRRLAEHYGIDAELPAEGFAQVTGVAAQHRGGLLGLGAVMAVTSAPLRTSAVKRGDWVLRRVLGTPVPPPPADAGSIAADEAAADGLTVRRRLEAHRTDVSCKNCHSRIDPLGFALEHFDPIGRWRTTYRDGQPIDPTGVLHDGSEIDGLDGLRAYLQRRRPDFERTLCVKLLGYALGRTETASDAPLIDRMLAELHDDDRFSRLVVQIVTSRQFRYRRT